jgi:hypothetical protein
VALVVNGDEEASGPSKDEAELLTGQAYRGGVHDGHQLFHILREEAEK